MANSVMTAEQFAYWLQGFFEISGSTELNQEQIKMVKTHLEYVFTVSPILLRGGGGASGHNYEGISGYSGYC